MNQSPMRRLLSSKLFLSASILFLALFLAEQGYQVLTLEASMKEPLKEALLVQGFEPALIEEIVSLSLLIMLVLGLVLTTALFAPFFVGSFMIYANARSGKPWKTAGFTLIKVYYVISVVLHTFSLFSLFLSMGTDTYSYIANLAEQGLALVVEVFGLQTAKACQEYARFGSTNRRISGILPVAIIISLCVQAGNLILTVIMYLVGASLPGAEAYQFQDLLSFGAVLLIGLLSMGVRALYLPLVNRLKTAITGSEPTEESEILLN